MTDLVLQAAGPVLSALVHRACDALSAAMRRRRQPGLFCTSPLFTRNDRGAAPVGKPGGPQ